MKAIKAFKDVDHEPEHQSGGQDYCSKLVRDVQSVLDILVNHFSLLNFLIIPGRE